MGTEDVLKRMGVITSKEGNESAGDKENPSKKTKKVSKPRSTPKETKGEVRRKVGRPKSNVVKEKKSYYLPSDLVREVKILAVDEKNESNVVENALMAYIKKRKREK